MIRMLSVLAVIALFVGESPVAAQVTPADSAYYDFRVGEWHQVIDGQVAQRPPVRASKNSWTFVWISERGHFQERYVKPEDDGIRF